MAMKENESAALAMDPVKAHERRVGFNPIDFWLESHLIMPILPNMVSLGLVISKNIESNARNDNSASKSGHGSSSHIFAPTLSFVSSSER